MKKDNIRRNISLLMEYFNIPSESHLARETGLGQATINKLVSGATEDPRLTTLLPIAERFNLTLDTLVSDSPNFSQKSEQSNDRQATFIPLASLKEIDDIYDSLSSLHFDNWPYWLPIPATSSSHQYFAIKLTKNYFPEPFNKSAILICEKTTEILNGVYCLVKHNNSEVISIMRILREGGKIWLLSLKKELPITEFNLDEWTYLSTIKTVVVDLLDENTFDFQSE